TFKELLLPVITGSIAGTFVIVIVTIILFLLYRKKRRRCRKASPKTLPDLRPPPVSEYRNSDHLNNTINNISDNNNVNDINEPEKSDTLNKLPDFSTPKMTPNFEKNKLLDVSKNTKVPLIGKASSEPNINTKPKSKATNSLDDADVKEYIDMKVSVQIKAPHPHKVSSRGYVNVVDNSREHVDMDSSQESDNYFNSQIALTPKKPSILNLETILVLDSTYCEDIQQDEYINMQEHFSSQSSNKQEDFISKNSEITDTVSSGEDNQDNYINVNEIPTNVENLHPEIMTSDIGMDNVKTNPENNINKYGLEDEIEPDNYINMGNWSDSQKSLIKKSHKTENKLNIFILSSNSTQHIAENDLPKEYINVANMNFLPPLVMNQTLQEDKASMNQTLQEDKASGFISKDDTATIASTVRKAPATLPKPKSKKIPTLVTMGEDMG
ncbi:hypothetical protein Btru_072314, partial [Bulinus truncatus]